MEQLLEKIAAKVDGGIPGWVWILAILTGLFTFWLHRSKKRLELRRKALESETALGRVVAKAGATSKSIEEFVREASKTETDLVKLKEDIRALDETLARATIRITTARSISDL